MRAIAIDTNLFVLLVVGSLDRNLIRKHKRTRSFTPEDFDLLTRQLARYTRIVVTPHVVAETSNLLGLADDSTTRRLRMRLQEILSALDERYVPSVEAAAAIGYHYLGITDSAFLHTTLADSVLLTADLPLYLQATRQGRRSINFNHLRFSGLFHE